MQARGKTRWASEEDGGLLSARSAGSELWLDPRRVSRLASQEDLSRCACGAVLLFGATVCWKCHRRSEAEQAIDDEFGVFYAGERQSAPDSGLAERTSLLPSLPARSASEPVLCRPRCEAPGALEPEPFGTAAGWEAILEDNDRAHRELERCRFELQDCYMELEESRGVVERLRARVAELELQVKPSSPELSEKQSTPGFGDEGHFAIEMADVASPSAWRIAADALEDGSPRPAGGDEELRAARSQLVAGPPPQAGVGRPLADALGSGAPEGAAALAEATGGGCRFIRSRPSDPTLPAYEGCSFNSEEQLTEVQAIGGAIRTDVRRLFADALASGALERILALEGTEAAPQVTPDARFLKASVRRLITSVIDKGALESALAVLPCGPPPSLSASPEGTQQGTPDVRFLKASVRRLITDVIDNGTLESALAVPPGGPPRSLLASAEGWLAKDQARELLGHDSLDEGLEQRLAQATAREEMAYRAALGECERLKAELAATVSAELERSGLLGPGRRGGEAVPSSPVAARTERMPQGADAAAAAAVRRGAAQLGLRDLLGRLQAQGGTVFGEMERRCRRLQQELVEQSALARGPPGDGGPTGAPDAPLVCELRRECERLRKDLAGAVLAERRAAGEAARLREQGRQMRGEWEHLRRELGGCLHQLGGRSPLHEPVCA